MTNTKDFDFELQLEEAQVAEHKLQTILKNGKFELKTERQQWHDKGNFVVEYESYKKPSGIASTKADYWVHELRSKEDETLVYLMFPTPILRKICNDLMNECEGKETNWRRGGQGNNMEMLLVKLEQILVRLRNFSGQGDEEFLTRRQRKDKEA